jgi:small subunit ribosomal protein S18
MGKKLFVSNLDFEISTEELTQMFSEFGECISVVIATDKETQRSKGFAFVEMENDDEAMAAVEGLNNRSVNNRTMKVVEDRGKNNSNSGSTEGGVRKYEILPPIQRMQLFRRRKKLDPFMQDPNKIIDYTDVTTLSKFVSERGRILPRRLTGLSAYNQREVSKKIKRAQNLGLIPYANH